MCLKAMKILFFTILFSGTSLVYGEAPKIYKCDYNILNEPIYQYTFDSGPLDRLAEELKRKIRETEDRNKLRIAMASGFGSDYEDPGYYSRRNVDDISHFLHSAKVRAYIEKALEEVNGFDGEVPVNRYTRKMAHMNEIIAAYRVEENRISEKRCQFNEGTISQKIVSSMDNLCDFSGTLRLCTSAGKKALFAACGKNEENKSGGCYGGAAGILSKWNREKSNLTPEQISHYTKKRDELIATAISLKAGQGPPSVRRSSGVGYEHCVWKTREVEEKQCFNAYEVIFKGEFERMVKNRCTIEDVDNYIGEFKNFMSSNNEKSFVSKFQNIRNFHVMARLCTIKVAEAANRLDIELKQVIEKRDQGLGRLSAPGRTVSGNSREGL